MPLLIPVHCSWSMHDPVTALFDRWKRKDQVVDLPESKSLRVRCRDKNGLSVLMEFKRAANKRCALLLHWGRKAFLEGMIVDEADLDIGAIVEVGKQRFEIAVPTAVQGQPRLVKNKEHLDQACSHCGAASPPKTAIMLGLMVSFASVFIALPRGCGHNTSLIGGIR